MEGTKRKMQLAWKEGVSQENVIHAERKACKWKKERAQKQEKKGKEVMRKDGKMSSWQQMKDEITLRTNLANYSGQPTFLSFCIIVGRIPSTHTHAHTHPPTVHIHILTTSIWVFLAKTKLVISILLVMEGAGNVKLKEHGWVGGWGVKQRTSSGSSRLQFWNPVKFFFISAMANCHILSCNSGRGELRLRKTEKLKTDPGGTPLVSGLEEHVLTYELVLPGFKGYLVQP